MSNIVIFYRSKGPLPLCSFSLKHNHAAPLTEKEKNNHAAPTYCSQGVAEWVLDAYWTTTQDARTTTIKCSYFQQDIYLCELWSLQMFTLFLCSFSFSISHYYNNKTSLTPISLWTLNPANSPSLQGYKLVFVTTCHVTLHI